MCIAIEVVNQPKQIEEFAKVRAKYSRVSFSVRKFLKQLFKQKKFNQSKKSSSASPASSILSLSSSILNHHRHLEKKEFILSLEDEMNGSLESFENSFNEIAERTSLECCENAANERLSATVQLQNDHSSLFEEDSMICHPVAQIIASSLQFVRTESGTFFWSTTSEPLQDEELIQPLHCNTDNQIAIPQVLSSNASLQLEMSYEI